MSDNLNQRYALTWNPGTQADHASLYYQDSEAEQRRVTGYGGSASYRLNRWIRFLANVTHVRVTELALRNGSTEHAAVEWAST